jgi:hypothetical protein
VGQARIGEIVGLIRLKGLLAAASLRQGIAAGKADFSRLAGWCDGLLKKDRRLKEKIVVPVVALGKVGKLPM